ncbi:Nucleoredoxin [Liparis tanakae]|uniref:Nucleoredoxin n=1 Tax=Liparis tanakae TaxID=230148 RepID=A0A4Z2HJX4_9TELE|nr:Nucleoredoxin [Liparis tanakae]
MSEFLVSLLGERLVNNENAEVDVQSLGAKLSLVGLFFGCSMNAPCKQFNGSLGEFYSRFKKASEHKDKLEIVFISSDQDQKHWQDFLQEMPWLALPFKDRHKKPSSAVWPKPSRDKGISITSSLPPRRFVAPGVRCLSRRDEPRIETVCKAFTGIRQERGFMHDPGLPCLPVLECEPLEEDASMKTDIMTVARRDSYLIGVRWSVVPFWKTWSNILLSSHVPDERHSVISACQTQPLRNIKADWRDRGGGGRSGFGVRLPLNHETVVFQLDTNGRRRAGAIIERYAAEFVLSKTELI